ncbi:MAG: tetratricopeptide repeat protein, partial [Anaerolineae bacterium]
VREVGDRAGEGTTLNNIGLVYNALGERRRALETYEAALAIRREVGDRAGEGTTLNNIGWIYLNEGDKAQARTYLEQALAIAEAVEYPDLANAARNGLAAVAGNELGNE